MLEAMACECVPILGNIESMREWVENGQNGLLVDPHDPEALAQAILDALQQPKFLDQANRIKKEILQNAPLKK